MPRRKSARGGRCRCRRGASRIGFPSPDRLTIGLMSGVRLRRVDERALLRPRSRRVVAFRARESWRQVDRSLARSSRAARRSNASLRRSSARAGSLRFFEPGICVVARHLPVFSIAGKRKADRADPVGQAASTSTSMPRRAKPRTSVRAADDGSPRLHRRRARHSRSRPMQ